MGKPILFDTISRSKFDNLTDELKSKKNYQIKEEGGKISKHIAGLEGVLPEVSTSDCGKAAIVDSSGNWVAAEISGGGGGGATVFNVITINASEVDPSASGELYKIDASKQALLNAYEVGTDIKLKLPDTSECGLITHQYGYIPTLAEMHVSDHTAHVFTGYYVSTTGDTEDLQFVDIKTQSPTTSEDFLDYFISTGK